MTSPKRGDLVDAWEFGTRLMVNLAWHLFEPGNPQQPPPGPPVPFCCAEFLADFAEAVKKYRSEKKALDSR